MPGRMLGRLLAINTAGAIVGSLLCGFFLLPTLGMWGTLKALTAAYLVMALLVPSGWGGAAIACRVVGLGALALLFTVLDPSGLPERSRCSFRWLPACLRGSFFQVGGYGGPARGETRFFAQLIG